MPRVKRSTDATDQATLEIIDSTITRMISYWYRSKEAFRRLKEATTDRDRLRNALDLTDSIRDAEQCDNRIVLWCRDLDHTLFPDGEPNKNASVEKQKLMTASLVMRSPVPETLTMDNPDKVAKEAFDRLVNLAKK